MNEQIPTPYPSYQGIVLPEWIDTNGHMNVAYYVLAFDQGTDALFNFLGLGEPYRHSHNASAFTIELHVNYLKEIREGDAFEIRSNVMGVDGKRVHVFHEMFHRETDELIAANENMFIHIDMATRRSSPFPDDIRHHIENVAAAHTTLPRPDNAGRAIREL